MNYPFIANARHLRYRAFTRNLFFALAVATAFSPAHADFWTGAVDSSSAEPGNWLETPASSDRGEVLELRCGKNYPVQWSQSPDPLLIDVGLDSKGGWGCDAMELPGIQMPSLRVSGANASLNVGDGGPGQITIGRGMPAEMIIAEGAAVQSTLLLLGHAVPNYPLFDDMEGTVTVTDEGSSLNVQDLNLGLWSPGRVQVLSGAALRASRVIMVGGTYAAHDKGEIKLRFKGIGVLRISGVNSSLQATDTLVGIHGLGTLEASGGATVSISPSSLEGVEDEPSLLEPTPLNGRGLVLGGVSYERATAEVMEWEKAQARMHVTGHGTNVTVTTVAGGDLPMVAFSITDAIPDMEGTLDQGVTALPTTAELTVADGATMTTTGNLQMTGRVSSGNIATLNIGEGGAPGEFVAPSITGGVDTAIVNFNHNGDIRFVPALKGSLSLRHLGSGTTTLVGAATQGGVTSVQAGTLVAGGEGAFSSASDVTVEAGGTLHANGHVQTVASLDHAGTVRLSGVAGSKSPAKAGSVQPGVQLNVAGNYTGRGGTLQIASVLAADGAPADQLVVHGDVVAGTAPTLIEVSNVGGAGALTQADGIPVVTVKGASAPGAFQLKSAVQAGNFIYKLKQVGSHWYLQSEEVVIPPSEQTITFEPQQGNREFVAGGSFAIDPVAVASSGLPVSYTSGTPEVCTVTGTTVTMVAAGTCTITATQPGDDGHLAAAPVSQSIVFAPPSTGGEDGGEPGEGNGNGEGPGEVRAVPTLGAWALMALSSVLAMWGVAGMRRRQR